ncbi:MAG: DUF2335 domain-containing protein [Candidatus Omnitrophica bacterium]|nr:DUF2335 domain-containing protein [Candidatus Omnitrophota bacterium]
MENKQKRQLPHHPNKNKSTKFATVHQEAVVQHYSGPLPAPQNFEHYEKILPGAAERILGMAESEQAARHKLEYEDLILRKADQEAYWRISHRGQWAAFFLAIIAIGCATALGISGREWIASAMVGSTFLGFIAAFLRPVKTCHSDQKDQTRKEPES